ncbi:MAG TPA: thioesterase family protein [Streptosporangiaceae bacterium]|nr:thioesterase family protein [Streptosporangiaceae bacterium]
MADLAVDSAVLPVGEDRYQATLSRDWDVWGPNGGYLAAVALRAAGLATALPRPASLSCQFLGPARFAEVELRATVARSGHRAEAVRVDMSQRGRAVLSASVWAVADGLSGPQYAVATPPSVPPPQELASIEELAAQWGPMPLPHRRNCDTRPVSWSPGTPGSLGESAMSGWLRLRPRATFPGDPWLDACRSVVHVDTTPFPALLLTCPNDMPPFVAPTLTLQVNFHDAAPEAEWLLVEGHGTALGGGLAAGRAAVWSPDGRLLATGAQQMLCRMLPARSPEPAHV